MCRGFFTFISCNAIKIFNAGGIGESDAGGVLETYSKFFLAQVIPISKQVAVMNFVISFNGNRCTFKF